MDLRALKLLLLLLSLTGCCVGEEVLPEGPLDALLGKNVTFKTLYGMKSDDDVLWNYSDGEESINVATLRRGVLTVPDDYKGRASINATNGYLTLTSLAAKDSGDYAVSFLTAGATLTGEIKLRVLEPVTDVVIKSDLVEAVETNSTVVLTCTAKGSFLRFSWLNNTTPIEIDGIRISEKKTETSHTLTIRDVTRFDLVGPIYCEAKNPLEKELSRPFNLTVFYGPDTVTIHPAKPNPYISSKADFNLTCSTPSLPPAVFTWYFNKEKILATGPVLTLKAINEAGLAKKEGDYTCLAQNSKTARFVASTAVKFAVMEPISGTKISGPTTVLIAGNSTANISCRATAGEVMKRIWLKDGQSLAGSSRVVFSEDKTSVLIDPLQKEDNGAFKCQLENYVNKEEATYTMVVNYGPELMRVEAKAEVEVEGEVVLECHVKSVPPPNFTWKLNGTVIPGKTQKLLTILQAKYTDSGIYTCEAHNAITGKKATASHTLSVKEEIYDGLSDGAIAGIVIACLVAVGAIIGMFFYCRTKVPAESPY